MGRLRNAAVVLLLFLTFLFSAAANLSIWANGTLLNTDRFVATVDRILDSPEVVDAVSGKLADAVLVRVQAALGQPDADPRLVGLLQLSGTASTQLIHDALQGAIAGIMMSSDTEAIRDAAVRAFHASLKRIVAEGGAVSVQGEQLVIDLGALVALLPLGDAGQNVDGQIVVASGDRLQVLSQSLSAMQAVELILPIVAILAGVLAVAIAGRRRRIFGWVGAALIAAGACDLLLAALATDWVVGLVVAESRVAAAAVTRGLLASLVFQSVLLILIGAAVVVGATLVGRLARPRT